MADGDVVFASRQWLFERAVRRIGQVLNEVFARIRPPVGRWRVADAVKFHLRGNPLTRVVCDRCLDDSRSVFAGEVEFSRACGNLYSQCVPRKQWNSGDRSVDRVFALRKPQPGCSVGLRHHCASIIGVRADGDSSVSNRSPQRIFDQYFHSRGINARLLISDRPHVR